MPEWKIILRSLFEWKGLTFLEGFLVDAIGGLVRILILLWKRLFEFCFCCNFLLNNFENISTEKIAKILVDIR
jgi:hypothetical protein